MRNKRFVAVHRGGPLTSENHKLLIAWAAACTEHVLHLYGEPVDKRLLNALKTAREWEKGNATVGDARKASVDCIDAAREALNPASIAVARSAGHAVATAHMADHAPGSADYALRAVKASGQSVEQERSWQDEQLPAEIRELVLTAREMRHLKI